MMPGFAVPPRRPVDQLLEAQRRLPVAAFRQVGWRTLRPIMTDDAHPDCDRRRWRLADGQHGDEIDQREVAVRFYRSHSEERVRRGGADKCQPEKHQGPQRQYGLESVRPMRFSGQSRQAFGFA